MSRRCAVITLLPFQIFQPLPVDAADIHESIVNPNAKIVKGYLPAMPPFNHLTEQQIADLIAYIESLKE